MTEKNENLVLLNMEPRQDIPDILKGDTGEKIVINISKKNSGRGRPQSETLKALLGMAVGTTLSITHGDISCQYPHRHVCSLNAMISLLNRRNERQYECITHRHEVAVVKRVK